VCIILFYVDLYVQPFSVPTIASTPMLMVGSAFIPSVYTDYIRCSSFRVIRSIIILYSLSSIHPEIGGHSIFPLRISSFILESMA
jgi:hypothetical protein